MIHKAVSTILYTAQYSSYFFLLAFFNRKFKEEFLQRVLHDKLRVHGVFKKNHKTSPTSTEVPRGRTRDSSESSLSGQAVKAEAEVKTFLRKTDDQDV